MTFPATDMPGFALFWRAMLPVTHYLDVQLHQVNHGMTASQALPQLLCPVGLSGDFVAGQLASVEIGQVATGGCMSWRSLFKFEPKGDIYQPFYSIHRVRWGIDLLLPLPTAIYQPTAS